MNTETMSSDSEFETGASGASNTFPQQCSALRKNGHVVIKNRPCKIVEMSRSQPGKHGHAKIHLVALDIFTQKKYEDICPAGHNMKVPNVTRKDLQLVNIGYDGYMSLMEETCELRSDLKLPDGDLGQQIRKRFDNDEDILVTVLKAMGEESVMGIKGMSSKYAKED